MGALPSFRKLACENEGGGREFSAGEKKKGSREGSRGHTRCARGRRGEGRREKLGGGAVCYGKFWSGGGVGREGEDSGRSVAGMHGGSGKGDRGRRKRRKKRVCGGGEGRQEMGKRRGGRTTGFLIYWSLKLLREKGGKGDSEEGGGGESD